MLADLNYPTTRCLKRDAVPEVVDAVREIESRADESYKELGLLSVHSNVAMWAVMTGGVELLENEIAKHGDNSEYVEAALMNAGLFIPVALKWAFEHARAASRLAGRRWTPLLSRHVNQALTAAYNYSSFQLFLPMWHKNRYAVELLSPNVARFTPSQSMRSRQITAYQQGRRPTEGTYKGRRAQKVQMSSAVMREFGALHRTWRKTGLRRFEYDNPRDLWLALLPEYQARVASISRRNTSLVLGKYTLGDFLKFYAALLAVSAGHEFLCYEWQQHSGTYPLDSAVLVWPRASWIASLSDMSEVPREMCDFMIQDLTLDISRPTNLHVHPFVALDGSAMTLAVAPHFPLFSRPDENILYVCSKRRPTEFFDATSVEKESEMQAALRAKCHARSLQGPISLPKPVPDIDLLVTDEVSSTVVVCELKWIRKPNRPIEWIARDEDVLKGFAQLSEIRRFLNENPHHLFSCDKLPKPLDAYKNVFYILVARDHWLWVEPADNISIIEFDAFSNALNGPDPLDLAVGNLLIYDWLPVEDRDFNVEYRSSKVNGVSIESELYFPRQARPGARA